MTTPGGAGTTGGEPVLISVYVPLAVTAALTVFAPRMSRRLAPRPAAWALACAALVTAVGWTGSLALLAFTGVAQIPQVAAEGRWSVPALRAEDPVHLTVAVVSALTLLAGAVSLVLAAVRQAGHLLRARRECARAPGDSQLVVIDDDTPQAFALPGAPGRIVVSRGMLRCLGNEEREALLAHERAHLRSRHHLFHILWRLTAAVNPLLRPLADAGGFALERWADEEAAAEVGSRRVVARAVGRAALASASRATSTPALAVTGGDVPQRVRALLAPPPPRRTLPIAGGALLLTLCCASLANAASDSDRMVDDAQRARCAASLTPSSATRRDGFHDTPDVHCRHREPGEREGHGG
ncbi:M56 family metallopeptidase [Streptomyces sp. G-G2]|uniref:M56 family metallopeptidase n=1 Tax=Streptomyces sp. G-G2 TaxID=3046201 RepID=UPI0024BAA178|nr:M56 family metallopeptidase [Streptomyces sp. G-G2]MDJ0383528.1 M56 family metallopeptidase [Streptomyces sp. G-G2]